MNPWPTEIRLDAAKSTLTVSFDTGERFALPAEIGSANVTAFGHPADDRVYLFPVTTRRNVVAVLYTVAGSRRVEFAPLELLAGVLEETMQAAGYSPNSMQEANRHDLLTRLLVSVLRTGLAPRSFHAPGAGKGAHFDGLPVDFVAAAMVALSSAGGGGLATYQVTNTHWDDGISLDTLIDWLEAAGQPLERVEDHGAWFKAFGARLRALPPDEQRGSALPILQRWANPTPGHDLLHADGTLFRKAVEQLRPGGETVPPHLDEPFLRKYLEDLKALGLVGPGPPAPIHFTTR